MRLYVKKGILFFAMIYQLLFLYEIQIHNMDLSAWKLIFFSFFLSRSGEKSNNNYNIIMISGIVGLSQGNAWLSHV